MTDTEKMVFALDLMIQKNELIQEGKGAGERRKMLENYLYTGEDLRNVLIADDVMTTGSSLYGAYTVLRPHAKKIQAVCLAKAG